MASTLALYPGMAAARAGMASGVAGCRAGRAALEAFARASGFDVLELATAAPPADVFAERSWELGVTATEVAATWAWREHGGSVDGALGFSIGVYAALEAAGVVTITQIVRMIDIVLEASRRLRGRFAMAAVTGLGRAAVLEACRRSGAEIAAEVNTAQFLVAGRHEAVQAAGRMLEPDLLSWKLLPVPWPLHTSQMREVAGALEAARETVGPLQPPRIPVFSACGGGSRVESADEAWDLLTGQLWQPQSLPAAFLRAERDGFGVAVELGPGKTMQRALRWTCRDRVAVGAVPWERSEGWV